MDLKNEKIDLMHSAENELSDDALEMISGGGRTGGGSHKGKCEALYSKGQQLRILKYDGTTMIVRVRSGTVIKMQYKDDIWQYQLENSWGFTTDWINEDELGPA